MRKKQPNDVEIILSLKVKNEIIREKVFLSWNNDTYYAPNIERFIDEAYPKLKRIISDRYRKVIKNEKNKDINKQQ